MKAAYNVSGTCGFPQSPPGVAKIMHAFGIAVSVYVLVAIVRKRLGLEGSFYQILQILGLTLFEKTILCALHTTDASANFAKNVNQLSLFEF